MRYRITAQCTNGDRHPIVEFYEDVNRARSTADWMHNNPSLMDVVLEEPFGVRLTQNNGTSVVEHCDTLDAANDSAASWNKVVANRKVNRTRIRHVEVLGAPVRTAVATAEDLMLSEAMLTVLEDPKALPSVKFDIHRWFDSKVWK